MGAYSSEKLTVVYLEASKSVDDEKNSLVAVWIQPTALQNFRRYVVSLPIVYGRDFPKQS